MTSNLEQKKEWVHCNRCLCETKHFLIATHSQEISELYEGVNIWWHTDYALLECCGCEHVTLRRECTCSENSLTVTGFDGEEVEDYYYPEVTFYPPQVSRRLPNWHKELPSEIQELLTEIYAALHSNSRRLALMGARTVIDTFVLDKLGDVGTFQDKLKELVKNGYLADKQKEILDVAIEAGNAAVHRGYNPKPEDLSHVIDIVESLLQSYSLKKTSDSVKGKIPDRSRSKKSRENPDAL